MIRMLHCCQTQTRSDDLYRKVYESYWAQEIKPLIDELDFQGLNLLEWIAHILRS